MTDKDTSTDSLNNISTIQLFEGKDEIGNVAFQKMMEKVGKALTISSSNPAELPSSAFIRLCGEEEEEYFKMKDAKGEIPSHHKYNNGKYKKSRILPGSYQNLKSQLKGILLHSENNGLSLKDIELAINGKTRAQIMKEVALRKAGGEVALLNLQSKSLCKKIYSLNISNEEKKDLFEYLIKLSTSYFNAL